MFFSTALCYEWPSQIYIKKQKEWFSLIIKPIGLKKNNVSTVLPALLLEIKYIEKKG